MLSFKLFKLFIFHECLVFIQPIFLEAWEFSGRFLLDQLLLAFFTFEFNPFWEFGFVLKLIYQTLRPVFIKEWPIFIIEFFHFFHFAFGLPFFRFIIDDIEVFRLFGIFINDLLPFISFR